MDVSYFQKYSSKEFRAAQKEGGKQLGKIVEKELKGKTFILGDQMLSDLQLEEENKESDQHVEEDLDLEDDEEDFLSGKARGNLASGAVCDLSFSFFFFHTEICQKKFCWGLDEGKVEEKSHAERVSEREGTKSREISGSVWTEKQHKGEGGLFLFQGGSQLVLDR